MKQKTLALAVTLSLAVLGAARAEITASDAFDTLKGMAGTWRGTPEGSGDEARAEAEAAAEVVHEIELSAAGTVIMETMNPGTEHEMINMYHRDGEDLVLTHYCAGGNQPTMRMNRQRSTAEHLVFDFTGGTNLDAETDHFIHDMELAIHGEDRVESIWRSWAAGEPAGGMTFHLARSD